MTAQTAVGEIMGLRHRDIRIYGVQFHPESIMTMEGMNLLRNFLRRRRGGRQGGRDGRRAEGKSEKM